MCKNNKTGLSESKLGKINKNDNITNNGKKVKKSLLFDNASNWSYKRRRKRGTLANVFKNFEGKEKASVFQDFRERNVFLDSPKTSKNKMTASEKRQLNELVDELKKEKMDDFMKDVNIVAIKKRLSLTKSKSKILKNMIDDYKNGKDLSLLIKKSNQKIKDLNKEDINNVLDHYQQQKEKKRKSFLKRVEVLTKNVSLTPSKVEVLDKIKGEYKKGTFSLSDIPNLSKMSLKDLNKDNLHNILQHYKEDNKKKSTDVTFVKLSKLKFNSFRAKMRSM